MGHRGPERDDLKMGSAPMANLDDPDTRELIEPQTCLGAVPERGDLGGEHGDKLSATLTGSGDPASGRRFPRHDGGDYAMWREEREGQEIQAQG